MNGFMLMNAQSMESVMASTSKRWRGQKKNLRSTVYDGDSDPEGITSGEKSELEHFKHHFIIVTIEWFVLCRSCECCSILWWCCNQALFSCSSRLVSCYCLSVNLPWKDQFIIVFISVVGPCVPANVLHGHAGEKLGKSRCTWTCSFLSQKIWII